MTTNLRIVTPPTAEPLTLGEAMDHLNIELDDRSKDRWILRNIPTARGVAEEYLEFPLTDAVYEYRVNSFDACGIELPLGNVSEVQSITYVDTDGAVQTLDTSVYAFDDNRRKPTVRLAYGETWPSTRSEANAVRITFKGIYSETDSPPNSPPEQIKSAIGMILAHLDANRESVVIGQVSAVEVPMGAIYLLRPFRLGMGV